MAQQRSNKKFILGIAVAALLPLSFFAIAKLLKKDHIQMPGHYGVERVLQPGDTLWRTIPDLTGTNQMGEAVSINESLRGKVVAVTAFFATCTSVCPKLNTNLALIQKAFRRTAQRSNDTMMQLVSITTMPEQDSVPVLRDYASRYKANPDRWWFINAAKGPSNDYLRNQLKLSGGDGSGGMDDLMHSQTIVLLDKHRHIRGYYDGLDPVQVKKCADDIVLLALEKERKNN
ncbi:MAG: SCO family protein [Sphingobacteriales bacterium]|nr:MAG: SCO family protein [Sphingobacteriales bacterium]